MWHRATKALRESGELQLIGVVQEQHPERTRLYAQWQELDWPILWDPLNVTNSAAVPRVTLLDEHGIVRSRRPDPDTIAELVHTSYPPPSDPDSRIIVDEPGLLPSITLRGDAPERPYWDALSGVLAGEELDAAIATLDARVEAHPDDGRGWFRLGVARRMRHDLEERPGDFQGAIDAWERALQIEPRQYIWRRRIQQYGPLLDKPYPFYPWLDEARDAVRARGATPIAVPQRLSYSERAPRRPDAPLPESPHADRDAYMAALEGEVTRGGLLGLETVIVRDTDHRRRVLRLYVGVRSREGLLWDGAAGDLRVRFCPGEEGGARPARWELTQASEAVESLGVRWLEVDVKLPEEGRAALRGDIIVPVRESADDPAKLVRLPFELLL